jgi:hypothetical protein
MHTGIKLDFNVEMSRLAGPEKRAERVFIPIRLQDEPNALVLWASGFVARSLQIAEDMRLARASPESQNPARLNLILKAHWN